MTAKIKLNAASGGGSVSLKAPSTTTSNAAVELQLPVEDGSADTFLKTNGSGALSFAAAGGGKFTSYAVLADVKAYNAEGGTFTSGAWRTRDLNTEVTDADGIVSISSNQFTLQAGSYLIKARCPAYNVNRHVCRLYNITDSSEVILGSSTFNLTDGQVDSTLSGKTTISSAKVFEIQHRCNSTSPNTLGQGIGNDFSSVNSVFTVVEIYKEL